LLIATRVTNSVLNYLIVIVNIGDFELLNYLYLTPSATLSYLIHEDFTIISDKSDNYLVLCSETPVKSSMFEKFA
jgi:hypothetical protein